MTIRPTPTGVCLELHVQPGASRTEVAGLHGDRLKLRIAAPPVEGKANDAVIEWIAGRCGVPRARVRIMRGAGSRRKSVEIEGVTVEAVRGALGVG